MFCAKIEFNREKIRKKSGKLQLEPIVAFN